ncbi:hypothetical protein Mapa_003778 [Marchantia paleacea]|nr:hypothetical protein Mapa_003778 [Marchantia paleacea]
MALQRTESAVGDVAGQPVEAFVHALSGCGTGALDVPMALPQRVQAQLVGDLGSVHGIGQILLVGKNQQHCITKLIFIHHSVQLVTGLGNTISVVAVHHENQALSVLEVMLPQRPDLVLTSHIPHREADVLVLHRLHVETDRRNGGHNLSQLQLVQNRRLSSRIQTHHQNSHLLLSKKPLEQLGESEPHFGSELLELPDQLHFSKLQQMFLTGPSGPNSYSPLARVQTSGNEKRATQNRKEGKTREGREVMDLTDFSSS